MDSSGYRVPPGATGDRPRLLVIASTFPREPGDGTPAFVADLAREEAKQFTTLVLVPRIAGAADQERRDGYAVRRFGYFPRPFESIAEGAILENVRRRRTVLAQVPALFVAEYAAVRRAVRVFRPDVLHVHWIVPQGLVALAAAPQLPRVVTTLGGDLYALDTRAWRAAKRRVLATADAVTVMNADMARIVREHGTPDDRTYVMPMGADAARVLAAGEGAERAANRIVFVGRLVEKKGVAVLFEALKDLTGWTLDVVGDGPLRAELVARAKSLPGRVTFHGQLGQTDVAELWHRAGLGVFPSLRAQSGDQDGLPVALIEAMTAGTAVVASALPGIDEAITDGTTGILVPPSDVPALRSAISDLLGDHARQAHLGAAAAVRARDFSVTRVGERYTQLLAEVLAAPRR